MAQPGKISRRPRIRKTAPTVRERVEAAQAQTEKKPRRVSLPRVRLNLPGGKALAKLAPALRPVGKVLKFLVPRYFVNAWRELRQVTWTSRRETWRRTIAVFVFAIVFGAMVAVVDKGLDEVFKKVVLK